MLINILDKFNTGITYYFTCYVVSATQLKNGYTHGFTHPLGTRINEDK